jgi:hypothetical protein
VNGTVRKLLVVLSLTLCIGAHVLEVSGRWDRTFSDANDEAGIVAVVLCIGVAIAVAGILLERLLARTARVFNVAPPIGAVRLPAFRLPLPVPITDPPLIPLRI